jgi:uncharacterized OB-fold protein
VTRVPVRAGLFTEGDRAALVGGRCGSCATYNFPFSTTCPYCSSQSVEEVELSTEGRLWAWTSVTSAPPGYRGTIPYGFGVVELPEGIRVVSRLTERDPGRLSIGQEMVLGVVGLHNDGEDGDVVTYAFSPKGSS